MPSEMSNGFSWIVGDDPAMDRALDLVCPLIEEPRVSLPVLSTVAASCADEGRHPSAEMSSALRWCASS